MVRRRAEIAQKSVSILAHATIISMKRNVDGWRLLLTICDCFAEGGNAEGGDSRQSLKSFFLRHVLARCLADELHESAMGSDRLQAGSAQEHPPLASSTLLENLACALQIVADHVSESFSDGAAICNGDEDLMLASWRVLARMCVTCAAHVATILESSATQQRSFTATSLLSFA